MKAVKYFFIITVASCFVLLANAQRVGINTTSPLALLHVKDSNVVFTGPAVLPAIPGMPPISGPGTRMMWYPNKASLRVGSVVSDAWDMNNIGNNSFAAGSNTRATGGFSSAMGNTTIASGSNSTALGNFTEASGIASTAMGDNTIAEGLFSTAIGNMSIARGEASIALGRANTSVGIASMAIGANTLATGDFSTVMGIATRSRAFGSLTLGRLNDSIITSSPTSWIDTDPIFIIGNGTTSNRKNTFIILKNGKTGINTSAPLAMLHVKDSSVLFEGPITLPPLEPGLPPMSGVGTRMMWYPDKAAFRAGRANANEWDAANIGTYSFAGGVGNKASGFQSTAFGQNNSALSSATIAMGNGTVASGSISTAIGNQTLANGLIAIAFGNATTASGAISTAMGENTIASGTYTTALGKGTTAQAYGSLSIGQFNDSIITSSPTTYVSTDPVFIIGNGTANNSRNNAVTVLKNGKTGINTSAPLAMLHVKDSSVVFTGAASLPFSAGLPPVSGSGVRMMWYPDKAAFRAGWAGFNYWDKNFIGNYSFAAGNNTLAMGEASVALGDNNEAAGEFATAFGKSTQANGNYSTAMGQSTLASGEYSTAMGISTRAAGARSFAGGSGTTASGTASTSFGSGTNATNLASSSLGTATIASGVSALATGESSKAQGNVSSTMGFNTISRSYGSLAIGQFNDSIITSSQTTWVATDPVFIIGNGTAANSRKNAITVLKNGNFGINTSSPATALHVIENALSGGTYNSKATMILENNEDSYLQFSHPNNRETGLLSGNASTSIRSAIIFRADSSIFFRTGGNTTRAVINNTGDMGIGTASPVAKLDVNGDFKLGATGTVLAVVIKTTVTKDVPSIPANATSIQAFAVPAAPLLSSVMISPSATLNGGIVIGYARVSVAGTVQVAFINTTGAPIDLPSMDYYITVIQ